MFNNFVIHDEKLPPISCHKTNEASGRLVYEISSTSQLEILRKYIKSHGILTDAKYEISYSSDPLNEYLFEAENRRSDAFVRWYKGQVSKDAGEKAPIVTISKEVPTDWVYFLERMLYQADNAKDEWDSEAEEYVIKSISECHPSVYVTSRSLLGFFFNKNSDPRKYLLMMLDCEYMNQNQRYIDLLKHHFKGEFVNERVNKHIEWWENLHSTEF